MPRLSPTRHPIPPALTHYSSLPDEAHVRVDVVAGLIGASRATIYRMVSRGRLPAPRKLSPGVSAWRVGDLRQSLAAMVQEAAP